MSNLDSTVLILDKNYHPVRIVSAKIAILMLFAERASILDADYNNYSLEEWIEYSSIVDSKELPILRSSRISVLVPEVIVLSNYVRKSGHGKHIRYSRSSIFKRDNCICQYCGVEFKKSELTVDHIVPKSKGGKSTWLNIVTACKPCNWAKADRTPEEAKMKLLNPPRIPTWRDTVDRPLLKSKNTWENFLAR